MSKTLYGWHIWQQYIEDLVIGCKLTPFMNAPIQRNMITLLESMRFPTERRDRARIHWHIQRPSALDRVPAVCIFT